MNIHCFDVDGKQVSVPLAAHIINEIDISDDSAEESTGKALLAHILGWLRKLGLSDQEIQQVWTLQLKKLVTFLWENYSGK